MFISLVNHCHALSRGLRLHSLARSLACGNSPRGPRSDSKADTLRVFFAVRVVCAGKRHGRPRRLVVFHRYVVYSIDNGIVELRNRIFVENVQHPIADKDKDLTMSPPAGRVSFSFLHHYRFIHSSRTDFSLVSSSLLTRPTLFPRLVYPSLSSVLSSHSPVSRKDVLSIKT